MNVIKQIWFSLTLLSITSVTLGLILASESISLLLWLAVVASILLLATCLTMPLPNLQKLILLWFTWDVGTFLSVIFLSFLFVVFIHWIEFFVKPLVLISATILARLDLLAAGFNKWQTFLTLTSISLAALAIGIGIDLLFDNFAIQ